MDVITWTVVGGSLVFILGLFSAISARRQRKQKPDTHVTVIEQAEMISPKKKDDRAGEMSMAAGGTGNRTEREREFESKYGGALAGAGQGREH